MMERIAHRGGDRTKTITGPGVILQASWANVEARPVPIALQRLAVWDGVPVRKPAPDGLGSWSQPCALAAVSPRGLFLARGPLGCKAPLVRPNGGRGPRLRL